MRDLLLKRIVIYTRADGGSRRYPYIHGIVVYQDVAKVRMYVERIEYDKGVFMPALSTLSEEKQELLVRVHRRTDPENKDCDDFEALYVKPFYIGPDDYKILDELTAEEALTHPLGRIQDLSNTRRHHA